jgi:hypothetical protein
MLLVTTECCINRTHTLCVDAVAIRRIVPVEGGSMETCASSGMDEIDRHELLRGASVGIGPVLVRYRMSFSTAAVMASSLFGVRTVRG